MSVWDSLVGQKPVIDMLSRIAQGDPSQITQSWLICGPPGSGRSNMARAFAAALESPDHGMSAEPTRVTQQVLAGTHPDVTVLTTNKVTIGIDQVREIITTSEQMPATAPWRIIIIEDVDRMLERTTNVLLKEIEEPAEHCIWLLCAPSAQDVLPTIRSRTRIVNLAVPSTQAVAGFLTSTTNVEPKVAQRAARLAEGHIGIAKLYATDERVMSDRDELVVGVLNLARASDAVLLAGNLIDNAKAQAEADANRITAGQEAEFRRINGLAPNDRIPPKLRGAFNQIAKKDDVKRLVTRRIGSCAELHRLHLPRCGGAAEQCGGFGGPHQPGEPLVDHRIVGAIEPGRCRDPSGRSGLRPQAPSRQRQPATGIRVPLLRPDPITRRN